MSSILVVGTYAMDYIGSYSGSFANLPQPQALNLSIQLGDLRKGFGGCAMNIAVMLHKLGHHALPFAYVGNQLDPTYAAHLDGLGIDQSGLMRSAGHDLSSHALILTDDDENQFTAFFPGAPKRTFQADLKRVIDNPATSLEFVIIAPDSPDYMIAAAELCRENDLPFICDPGQCTTAFSTSDCRRLVGLSSMMSLNRYENEIFWKSVPEFESQLDLLIVTQGSAGVKFHYKDEWHSEHAAKPRMRVDPTGCGDAFRSGLVHAHLSGASWPDSVRAGCVLATINLEHSGTQLNSVADFSRRYQETWNDSPAWLDGSMNYA